MRTLLTATTAVIVLATASPHAPAAEPAGHASATAKSPSLAKLQRDVRKWKRRAVLYRRQRNRAEFALEDLREEVVTLRPLRSQLDAANEQLAAANGRIAQLEADNAALRQGLPAAIKAVPRDQFWALVFQPAREAWPCDSLYTSGAYWSLTFDSTNLC